ncbi:prepilin peptidase [Lachnospiraceae bacterium ZAX-1]
MTLTIAFVVFMAYIIGGYSTADILRLTKGIVPKQLDGLCRCPNCRYIIHGKHQIPIFSYILNKGKCRNCDEPIPRISFFLELCIPCSIILASGILRFSPFVVVVGFFAYQLIKVVSIILLGKQENNFIKRAILSLLSNTLFFAFCVLIVFVIQYIEMFLN